MTIFYFQGQKLKENRKEEEESKKTPEGHAQIFLESSTNSTFGIRTEKHIMSPTKGVGIWKTGSKQNLPLSESLAW